MGISASMSTYFAIDAGMDSLAEATGAVGALVWVVGRVAAKAAAIEVVIVVLILRSTSPTVMVNSTLNFLHPIGVRWLDPSGSVGNASAPAPGHLCAVLTLFFLQTCLPS